MLSHWDDYAWTVERLRAIHKRFQFFWAELRSPIRLSPGRTLRGWRRGFGRLANLVYGLDRNDPSLFVSSYVQLVSSLRINGYMDHLVNNKLLLSHLLKSAGLPCARTLAFRRNGQWLTSSGARVSDLPGWLGDILSREEKVVVKPVKGHKGHGLAFIEKSGNSFLVNGKRIGEKALDGLFPAKRDFLITGFVEQAEYACSLYPRTSNSLRLLTIWDIDANEPFVAAAAHRIGTSRSFPVDNWKEGLGGLSAEVNLGGGTLGAGATVEDGNRVVWYAHHPETGSPVRGVVVPRWDVIVNRICEGARHLSFIPLIGWDILLTDTDFCVLETNGLPGLHLHQVHRPLLADPRVRRFYRTYGLVT